MQKQLETRLFFNIVKNILICVLLAVVIIALLKKGFSLKKIKKILDEDDEPTDSTPPTRMIFITSPFSFGSPFSRG